MPDIDIVQADITTLSVDAIVNAANEALAGGGGVDGAIHRAAGPQLVAACRALPMVRPFVRCPTGEARLTAGFELPAKYVIHAVGPVWHGGHRGEAGLLAHTYRAALRLARDNDIHSLAFPAISCGVFGYPIEPATQIAVREVRSWQAAWPTRVIFCCFSSAVAESYRRNVATA